MTDDEWSVAEYQGIEGLKELEPDWRRIHLRMPEARSWQGWDAAYTYAQHLAPNPQELRYYAVSKGTEVRAIVPFETRTSHNLGFPVSILGSPIPREGPEGWPLVADAEVATVLLPLVLKAMRDAGVRKRWAVIGLMPTESAEWDPVRSDKKHVVMVSQGSRSCMEVKGSFEDYAATLTRNFRKSLRKSHNRLNQLEGVRFVTAQTPEDVRQVGEIAFEIAASGWKGAAGTAVIQIPHAAEWYRSWLDIMASEGLCEANAIYVGERCIAAQLCVITRNVLEMHKITYDESFHHFAPGKLLMEYTLKRCFDNPAITAIDLMSDSDWHTDWGALFGKPMSMAWIARSPLSTALVPLVRWRFGSVRRFEQRLLARRWARIRHASDHLSPQTPSPHTVT